MYGLERVTTLEYEERDPIMKPQFINRITQILLKRTRPAMTDPKTAEAGEVETTLDTEQSLEQTPDAAVRIAELEKELAEAHKAVSEHHDALLRTRAEMENVRRRAEGEIDKAQKFALEKFSRELLTVVDNLERALQVADASNEALKPMVEGIDLTLRGLVSTVGKFGVEVVDPVGQPFNPEFHQAMSLVESTEQAPNSVLAVMQKGYTLNGRLLRPAMVVVSRAPTEPLDTTA